MNATLTRFDRSSWPHLEFTEAGLTRFAEVAEFCNTHATAHPEVAEEFIDRLRYLDNFGGAVSDEDPRRRYRVRLGRDFAPYSFTLVWLRLDQESGEYEYAFNGGLIWHGGSNDPLCVSLTPQMWGIHT